MPTKIARALAESVAMRDSTRLRALLSHRVDFVALCPDKSWEANNRDDVVDIVVHRWFPDDLTLGLDRVDVDVLADRQRVGYRLTVEGDQGRGVLEHQAYISVIRDKVTWVRLLSSGIRWAASAEAESDAG